MKTVGLFLCELFFELKITFSFFYIVLQDGRLCNNVASAIWIFYSYLWLLIEFIEMTLVHKIIQVSSVQLNKTASAHWTVCPLPQAKFLSVPILPHLAHLHLPPTPFPSGLWLSPYSFLCLKRIYTYICIYIIYIHFLLNTFTFFHTAPQPPSCDFLILLKTCASSNELFKESRWLMLCINLSGQWCPDIWTDMILFCESIVFCMKLPF